MTVQLIVTLDDGGYGAPKLLESKDSIFHFQSLVLVQIDICQFEKKMTVYITDLKYV